MYRITTLIYATAFMLPLFAKADKAGSADPLPPADPAPPLPGVDDTVQAAPLPPVNDATPTVAAAEVAAKAERVKPKLTAVMAGLPVPAASIGVSNRVGAQTLYDFDGLVNVGDSFGVMNKTAEQIASTITGANKRYREQAKNADGTPKMTAATDIKDPAGNVIGQTKPEPIMEPGKVFKAFNVYTGSEPGPKGEEVYYPATTPDDQRAPCRVFRIK